LALNYVTVTLDTIAPPNPTITLDGGATYATSQLVNVSIGTTDTPTGYEMIIWCPQIDPTFDLNIGTTEETSEWFAYSPTKQIRVTNTEEQKTVYVRIRDDVHNESGISNDTIIYDASRPVVECSLPSVTRISKVAGRNEVSFTFTSNEPFAEYKVKVVDTTGASENLGTVIGTANGSSNTSGTGTFNTATAPIEVRINGSDLEIAKSGQGEKIIKVFVRNEANLWSA
jgi:hypothetical protein